MTVNGRTALSDSQTIWSILGKWKTVDLFISFIHLITLGHIIQGHSLSLQELYAPLDRYTSKLTLVSPNFNSPYKSPIPSCNRDNWSKSSNRSFIFDD